jgi:GT2 family glycosyltransferase
VTKNLAAEQTAVVQSKDVILSAVVVTYNRLAQLKVTLQRLFATPPAVLASIIVVNNASDDGTAQWLDQQNDPRLDVITTPTNIGGAGGFSTGMRHAVATYDPDWLVVMDDDGRPETNALQNFINDIQSKPGDVEAIASAVYLPNGEICVMNRPSRNPFWRMRDFLSTARNGSAGFHVESSDYDKPAQIIDVASFVGFFISRQGVARIGYPDPSYFIYGEDGIYSLALTKAGGKILFDPTVRFEHDLSTFKGAENRFHPLWKVYFYHRNLLFLYHQAAGWMFWPVLPVILAKWVLKLRAHGGQRIMFLRLLLLAIVHGLTGRRKMTLAQLTLWMDHRQ